MQEDDYRLIKMNTLIKSVLSSIVVLTAFFWGCCNQLKELENSNASNPSTTKTQDQFQLSEDDKTQIIVEILKHENLRAAKERKKDAPNIIYIEGQLPVKQIPQIKGLEVRFIPSFKEAGKQSEVVFYEFRDFQIEDSKILIPVIWNKRDPSSGHQAIIEYNCQKTSDGWKIEGKTVGLTVSESH